MQILDRAFIVTGASSGIGRELARVLVGRGGRVVLVARRAESIDGLVAELGPTATAIALDVTTLEAPDRIHKRGLDAHGRIDGLVNCAGRGLVGRIVDLDPEVLDEAFELNLVAPLRLIQRIAPTLVAQESGVIVNVSSPTGRLGLPKLAGYAMTKSALDTLTETLRRELRANGVHVMAVYPGVIESEFYDNVMGEPPGPDEKRPPARPARLVAEAIARGIEQNRREVWSLSAGERRRMTLMRLARRLMPATLDRALSRP